MKRVWGMAIAASVLIVPLAASAGDVDGSVTVGGHVTNLSCTLGTSPEDTVYDLGVMVDTATDYLRDDLSAPPKTIIGSFCNARSVISIVASRMEAGSFSGSAPTGFSAQVDYVATASGWTTTPAVFDTASASNPAASQIRDTAFSGDIVVSVSDFSTTGGDTLRMVSDPRYQGVVTVTLAVAS